MNQEPHFIGQEDRYSRLRLIGWWDQSRLQAARVLVVGAGALGNEVLKNLALLGTGTIHIVDFDHIETSNLSRSILYRAKDAGREKAAVAAESIRALNPDVNAVPIHGNVMTEIGLGLVRDVDVVIGCLDNREARLWVNRMCWKVGTPWIDGGIQEINGVAKVFVPPDGPCYECGMTETDYRLIQLRYSCPLLQQDDIQRGKVPTAPTIASIVGGLQVQECLKLLHDLPVNEGSAYVFNGSANRFYETKYPYREDCLSHDIYDPPIECSLTAGDSTVAQLLAEAQTHVDGKVLRLRLDRDLVVALACNSCDTERSVMLPLQKVGTHIAHCEKCQEMMKPRLRHTIERDDKLASRRLSEVGIPDCDIVRVESEDDEVFLALAASKKATT